MDAGQNVHVDVPLCHTGDLVPYDTQHQYTDGPQPVHADVHFEGSVRKIEQYNCKNSQYKISGKIWLLAI
jgi:hypothetical protein